MSYSSAGASTEQTDALMKTFLPPSDDFISEAVKMAKAERAPVSAPQGLSITDRAKYEAAIEAYREPASPHHNAQEKTNKPKILAFISSLGLF